MFKRILSFSAMILTAMCIPSSLPAASDSDNLFSIHNSEFSLQNAESVLLLAAADVPVILPAPSPSSPSATANTQPDSSSSATTSTPAPAPASTPAKLMPEEQAVRFLEKNEPEVYKWLQVVKEHDAKRYNELINQFAPEVRRLVDLQRRNSRLYELTLEDRRLSFRTLQIARDIQTVPETSTETNQRRQTLLNDLVRKQFDVRQKIRQTELEDLTRRVEELKKQLERLRLDLATREKSKEQLIKQRLDDLNTKNPKLEW